MKTAFIAFAALISVTLAPSAGSSVTLAPASAAPALRIVRLQPFTVRGLHFRQGERVTVTASLPTKGSYVRKRTTTAAGSFAVVLAGTSAETCLGYGVTAVGDKGSHAAIKRTPTMCPQPIQPVDN
jgi:hypothetical protein